MLGYPIPLTCVRRALSEPLNAVACSVEAEAGSSGELEDLIGDAAYSHVKEFESAKVEVFQVPQDSLEAFLNVILNQGYDLTDAAFEFGVDALKEYERAARERHAAALAAEGVDANFLSQQDGGVMGFFAQAPFIKEYFSLHQFKQAVDKCTDADLRAVERDLGVLREIALLLRRMLTIITRDMPEDFKRPAAEVLPAIFFAGRILIWADLSLRNRGFAQMIEYYLPEALRKFREEFNEKLERELSEASKAFAEAMEKSIEIITNGYGHEGQLAQ
jgi:hypothetical protein